MAALATLATCSLNQWVLDWEGNLARIKASILKAKEAGATLRTGPELEVCGYGWNFRENRYFTPWNRPTHVERYKLPPQIQQHQGTRQVPIGDVILSFNDTSLAAETCEELFTPKAPHIDLGLNGTEIFANGSGSHHSLRKLNERIALIMEATRKNGGVYLYANHSGCDGDRLQYDGCSMIMVNGNIVAQGSQFSLDDVEVVTATVDLEEVRSFRSSSARGFQAVQAPPYERIEVDFALTHDNIDNIEGPSPAIEPRYHLPEEEIALGPACWLWDYLRRSKGAGYLIPLSGGIDSCATATIVYSMCRIVVQAIKQGNNDVISDVKRIAAFSDKLPDTPEELCNQVFHTVYMGMSEQSSKETRQRAKDFANRIGSHHTDMNIDDTFHATKNLLTQGTGFEPKFKAHGGSVAENLALQNIQARSRMVVAYYYAQMLPTVRHRPGGGGLLVLGSSNVDECLRGYLTKYDCSSADINPIGAVSKMDLRRFVAWARKAFDMPILEEFLHATPSAELEPHSNNYVQSDEADMGMTYAELSRFGILRKQHKLGPYRMFLRLLSEWASDGKMSPREVADKVKRFHHYYYINRHKQTIATPAYFAEGYSPDDHRFDLRPFVYPPAFESWSFKKIDERVATLERKLGRK